MDLGQLNTYKTKQNHNTNTKKYSDKILFANLNKKICSDAGSFATFYAISFDDFRLPKGNGEAGKYGNRA